MVDVARLTQHWDCCADVVFDGHAPPAFAIYEGAVRARFSGRRTADDVIVALTEEAPRGEVIVSTSDRGLARRVIARGGRVVSSQTLHQALDRVAAAAYVGTHAKVPLLDHPSALLALERGGERQGQTA